MNDSAKKVETHEENLMEKVLGFFGHVTPKATDNSKPQTIDHEEVELMENLKKAHKDWKQAEIYFESVTEPDLIDHAIYHMEAARRKYIYLLKIAREKNIHVNI